MITSILEKCLTELGKEKADLSYVRGMLEVLLASQTTTVVAGKLPQGATTLVATVAQPTDEASILDAKARAAIEHIKSMSNTEIA